MKIRKEEESATSKSARRNSNKTMEGNDFHPRKRQIKQKDLLEDTS